ncbi:hypothetical protein EW145_g550 [Phellinidium pouzarii]|uniref:Nuclear pore complex protein NUP96 C-terminal domain-containing protein n=1 Tax=Phellinidium pouzarii TaxID=167371 RepID=A0A4S4LJP0_9AGAM|nr:hypothetical protein EW145_g550 [Phellinidium pouzarii]
MARFRAFTSDSEDESVLSSSSARSSRQPSVPKSAKPAHSSYASSSSSFSRESVEDDSADSEADSIMDEEEARRTPDLEEEELNEPTPWAQQLDLEPHRVHVMQTSLFRVPELAKAQQKETLSFLKHRRPSDAHFEPKEVPPRASFAQPRSHPPSRKYVRVASSQSITASYEGVYIDAGLSLGRSFRVGWGPGDKLVHVGELSNAESSSQSANSSIVNMTSFQSSSEKSPDLLQHLLSHTQIDPSFNEDAPYALSNHELTFSSFSSLFPAQDKTHAASGFRLGYALFDPLDLHLGKGVAADVRKRIVELRRADALSTWLSRTVSSSVEKDIKALATTDSVNIAFLHLSGNQVEKATDALTSGGNIRLATLISQVPGDDEFRADVREQLQIWKDEKVDAHMNEAVRRLYALAAGEIETLEGSSRKEDVVIAKGLDWLRVFGLQLWYSSLLDTGLLDTLNFYEQTIKESNNIDSFPTPWYLKAASKTTYTTDGLFNLIKLSLSPSMTLESALNPLSFSPNPRDYKLPWLIYIVLSRCLRRRDFTDRQLGDAMDEDTDITEDAGGYSQTANALTINYAMQLQQDGLIQEAAFVLMFLEDNVGRRRAIKELLMRSAPHLDEWNIRGLRGSLKIPQEWIDEAEANYAFYNGDIYLAYTLYTQAGVHRAAHELAITYLAPIAILRDDLDLLSSLFTVLDKSKIDDFGVGGQLFIDYIHIVTRVPALRERHQAEDAVPDAVEASELEMLTGRIPKLIGILPDVLRNKPGGSEESSAALSHMLSRLLDCLGPNQHTKIEIQPGLVDEAARLRQIHSAAYGSFMRTIATMAMCTQDRPGMERNPTAMMIPTYGILADKYAPNANNGVEDKKIFRDSSRHLDVIKGTGTLEWGSDTDAGSSVSSTDPSRGHAAVSMRLEQRLRNERLKLDVFSGCACQLYIRYSHVDGHTYTSHINVRDWVMAVESERQSSPDRTVSLLDSLHAVPRDVYLEAMHSNLTMSQTSAMARPSPNGSHPSLATSSLISSTPASDPAVSQGLNDWRQLMDESPSFQVPSTSSVRSSAQSSTVGMASTLPLGSSLLDESMSQSVHGHWVDTEGWSSIGEMGGGGSTSGSSRDNAVEDAYPRSATASSRRSDADFQLIGLPTVLEHEDLLALMLQSFTVALADASLEDHNNHRHIQGSEHDDTSNLSCPNYMPSLDFINKWSPPALRSSSSASSQDPFHLDLFSPTSDQPDAASIWDNFTQSPEDSASPGYYSSSPFVGWSSASDTETKPALLPMEYITPAPLSTIPLYQPQPIRLIPPIPLHLLDGSDDDPSNPNLGS